MNHHQRRVGVSGCLLTACVIGFGGNTSLCAGDNVTGDPVESAATAAEKFDLTAWLDAKYQKIWQAADVQPELCDDATYLRRVYLDLAGRIPSVAETRDFLQNPSADKRARLVDHLLVDPKNSGENRELFAEHQARTWRRILIPPGSTGAAMGAALDPWLEARFRENVPYDEIVRRLLTSREGSDAGATQAFYAATGGTPDAYATNVTRVFLGIRVGCAQCHPHPFADWEQDDFWGMAAFFVGANGNSNGLAPAPEQPASTPPSATISFEGKTYVAKYLWDEERAEIPDGEFATDVLADWLTDRSNPTFAATAVNRVWQYLLGRGLVIDADELDLASPEQRALVDEVAVMFEDSGYDLRWLVSGICNSRVYQCVSENRDGEDASLQDGTRPLKTLTPQQVFDSLEQALMLPVTQSSDEAARHNGEMVQLVQRLDESAGRSPEEYAAGVPQVLMLMNGRLTADATDLEHSRTLRAVVDAPFLGEEQKFEALFLAALTRYPSDQERQKLKEHIDAQTTVETRRAAYGEILWALINSPEFVLCR